MKLPVAAALPFLLASTSTGRAVCATSRQVLPALPEHSSIRQRVARCNEKAIASKRHVTAASVTWGLGQRVLRVSLGNEAIGEACQHRSSFEQFNFSPSSLESTCGFRAKCCSPRVTEV